MSVLSIGSLRRLADAEGLARVELAVSSAREGVRQSTEDLLTAAHILGERPALQRSLRGPMVETLPVLARYCETVALGACALVRDEEILATTSDDLDWKSRARGCRRAGRALPRDRRAAGGGALGSAGGRHRACRRHGARASRARRGARDAPHGTDRRRNRDHRLRFVRARRRAAGDLEHGCVVARRRRGGLYRRARRVCRQPARRGGDRRDDRLARRAAAGRGSARHGQRHHDAASSSSPR